MTHAAELISAAQTLAGETASLHLVEPIAHAYNPLTYAWIPHRIYLARYGDGPRRVVFLGMNPGPWGMAQTGVPFGDLEMVRDWLGVEGSVGRPRDGHPRRPVNGFDCHRAEVSGRRLWGFFRERFESAERFFFAHFVSNYCPLLFLTREGRNVTPDRLPAAMRNDLFEMCDRHLVRVVEVLRPQVVVGVGGFAFGRAGEALEGMPVRVVRILHPSPASPAANRDWSGTVTRQLEEAGVW